MAERKRRGADPDDENFDEVEAEDEAAKTEEPVSRGGTATKSRQKAGPVDERPVRTKETDTAKLGPFGRIGRFVREIVAELRKVIWPTRKDLLTFATVVMIFIAVMMAIVAGLDYAFAKGVLFVFGNPN